ncbi:uncharacterized protein T551_01497 [Pneumocystis jirovecii RU7]|uniref:Nuclear speckle splicing regulatory protein 1 N-terminal domain-containing protein n=1 Tax=Pneumocystis jirovecii (strain RU7) TaxID=1408657 RepID=A0A0W4ZRE4_PNEJ7|nr:uncharacterized protein T551_01497 [Pneumocystis jirovecii RU7]KTW30945.1 hypothetical protein T551_01497 [Pneumocystis jirovecii RU7]
MSIQFGLNISKSSKIPKNTQRTVGLSLFGEEDESTDENFFEDRTKVVNQELNLHSQFSYKNNKDNDYDREIDPSVYEYDEIYDEMKDAQKKRRTETEEDKEQRKPKYMDKFFRLASIRERDRLRAQEKMLQIERQAEGDIYNDKEKFITDAYKKQQEELSRFEEEENAREALMKKKSKGIISFYRNILEETEKDHNEVIKAISKSHKISKVTEETSKERTAEEIAKELNEKGANVIVNDDGEVVDKRQLLSAGLNVAKKSIKVSQEFLKMQRNSYNSKFTSKPFDAQRREREFLLIQEQIKKTEKEREEIERLKHEKLVIDSQQKRSSEEINKIKERYLKRKGEYTLLL